MLYDSRSAFKDVVIEEGKLISRTSDGILPFLRESVEVDGRTMNRMLLLCT
jgi:hypothetical protein